MKRAPLVMLSMLIARHYVWPLFPEAMQTSVWTIGSAAVVIALIIFAVFVGSWLGAPFVPTLAVGLWWIVEEVVTIGCELAYLANKLTPTGDERCTAQLGFKFGTFGIFAISLLALALIPDRTSRPQK